MLHLHTHSLSRKSIGKETERRPGRAGSNLPNLSSLSTNTNCGSLWSTALESRGELEHSRARVQHTPGRYQDALFPHTLTQRAVHTRPRPLPPVCRLLRDWRLLLPFYAFFLEALLTNCEWMCTGRTPLAVKSRGLLYGELARPT